MSRTSKPLRSLLTGLLCTSLLLLPVPKVSAATMTEYALLLVAILLLAASANDADLPPGSQVVINQLDLSVEGARAANIVGNSTAEFSRLSKAIGAAQALIGMTSACSDCGEVKDLLQQIIGHAAVLKTRIAGASGTCNPNGIVQPNEQCDPLAIPTGCPVNTTEVTYCSDECLCEVPLIP